jgi:hypothetical protein
MNISEQHIASTFVISDYDTPTDWQSSIGLHVATFQKIAVLNYVHVTLQKCLVPLS